MSCTILTSGDFPPACISTSLRLIEHYELDYHLAPDAAGDSPQDGEQISARRWNSYYCTTCHADFSSRFLAFAHTGENADSYDRQPEYGNR